jgi:hypothetical protein
MKHSWPSRFSPARKTNPIEAILGVNETNSGLGGKRPVSAAPGLTFNYLP